MRPLFIGFNVAYLFFLLLPLSLMQFLPLLYIVLVVLKVVKVPFVQKISMRDPKKSAFWLGERAKKEGEQLIWLVNNINIKSFLALFTLYTFFWFVEHILGDVWAWWLFLNLLIKYAETTRMAKSYIKKFLGYEDEYSTYVVNVKSPNSPSPEKNSDSDF